MVFFPAAVMHSPKIGPKPLCRKPFGITATITAKPTQKTARNPFVVRFAGITVKALAKHDNRRKLIGSRLALHLPYDMTTRKTSIALTQREIERFQQAADARGLSFSKFMSQAAASVLDTADARAALKEFAADHRADLSRVLERLLEADALQAQERARFLEEQRLVHGNFLADLKASQREAVKEAFLYGQTKPRPAAPADHGHHSVPQLKGNQ